MPDIGVWLSILMIIFGCHLITVFKSAIKRSETFKTHGQGNVKHGHITFNQQKGSLPAADRSQILNHGAAKMIMEQAGKTALAVAKLTGKMLHADGLLVIVLQISLKLVLYLY